MQHISFSFSFIILVLTISHQTASSVLINPTSPSDIINQTCKKCADKSSVFSYSFCSASLKAVPVSRAITNLQGLALVAMELAIENATSTISAIKQLLGNETPAPFDPLSSRCLEDCLELYSDGVETLVGAMVAFLGERYDTARVWLSAVMDAAETCEEGFKEMGREAVNPLETENYRLFQLCDIALCIGHLLTSHEGL
ncbi:Putative invertase inhibitor [Morus notabilis]|uniref:Putative invertase inhibitor n=1 Tax=Morus notabilis TaxID=981085 RepID=W9S5F1_9ROSA|nr:putative invertase inhibitor [Morus notabilis]EXC26732.1 Putative invertase inhibitor [Morus notabilis]